MAERYVNIDRRTPMLLPVDLRDWVAENDLARLIVEVVEQCDLGQAWTNERGSGSAQYPPGMMLSLLIYATLEECFPLVALSTLATRTSRCVICAPIPIPITTPSRNFDERTERYLKLVLARCWSWPGK